MCVVVIENEVYDDYYIWLIIIFCDLRLASILRFFIFYDTTKHDSKFVL